MFSKSILLKVLEIIGQSSFVNIYSRYLQVKLDKVSTAKVFEYGDRLASEKYQLLGKKAQFAVGVSDFRHLPIKKLNSYAPGTLLVGAITEASAIYVNERLLDRASYGTAYSLLCRQAVSVKYHDKALDQIIEIIALLVVFFGMYALLSSLKIVLALNVIVSLIVSLAFNTYIHFKFKSFVARRSDIEGHLATQCATCIKESSYRRRELFEQENSPFKDSGCLWADDLEELAQQLDDKICSYHSDGQLGL